MTVIVAENKINLDQIRLLNNRLIELEQEEEYKHRLDVQYGVKRV